MSGRFCVNKNGDHEVHNVTEGCGHLPDINNQENLGYHPDCHSAVRQAKQLGYEADGCYYCCEDCHTG